MSDDDMEALGQLVDRLDAASYATVLPLPDVIHAAALSEIVRSVRDELKEFCVSHGFNPWSDA